MWHIHERTCLEIWHLANRNLFHGRLKKEPQFRVWDADNCSGHFHVIFDSPVIEIHEVLFEKGMEHEIIETIVHEMVHQLQWESGRPIGHDQYFKKVMSDIWGCDEYSC
jgi:predicted SprT family Zn-dependent metalloprotease